MMKFLIVAVLVLCITTSGVMGGVFSEISKEAQKYQKSVQEARAASSEIFCPVVHCLGEGDTCTVIVNNPEAACTTEGTPPTLHCDYCANGLKCVSGKCTTNVLNSECNSDDDCSIGSAYIEYDCDDGQCELETYDNRGINADCTNTDQCFGNEVCTNGICTGVAPGGACKGKDEMDDCVWGFYCFDDGEDSNKTCIAWEPQGAECDDDLECNLEESLVCIDGTCKKTFSVTAGGICDNDLGECQFGLTCDNVGGGDRQCTSLTYDFTPVGNCTVDPDTSCDDDYACQCQSDGSAKCVQTLEGAYIPTDCEDSTKSYVDCIIDNECKDDSLYEGSCVYKHCKDEAICFGACYGNLLQEANSISSDCVYTMDSCSSASGLFLALGAIVVSLILALF